MHSEISGLIVESVARAELEISGLIVESVARAEFPDPGRERGLGARGGRGTGARAGARRGWTRSRRVRDGGDARGRALPRAAGRPGAGPLFKV